MLGKVISNCKLELPLQKTLVRHYRMRMYVSVSLNKNISIANNLQTVKLIKKVLTFTRSLSPLDVSTTNLVSVDE
jgi:hypothetical protein